MTKGTEIPFNPPEEAGLSLSLETTVEIALDFLQGEAVATIQNGNYASEHNPASQV